MYKIVKIYAIILLVAGIMAVYRLPAEYLVLGGVSYILIVAGLLWDEFKKKPDEAVSEIGYSLVFFGYLVLFSGLMFLGSL